MASVTNQQCRRPALRGSFAIALLLGSLSTSSPAAAATPCALPADGSCAPIVGPQPVVDVPAPYLWDEQAQRRVGAVAYRFALDDPTAAGELSAWYYVAYIVGGDRLRVYDDTVSGTRGPDAAITRSQNDAWHVANDLLDASGGIAQPLAVPDWALARTGTTDGPSAGLIFTLAYLDVLTPGRLTGGLRVAGTGAIDSDGVVRTVRLVDAKLAAARLAEPDVFFAPTIPNGSGPVTEVVTQQGDSSPHGSIGDWLNTSAYEEAGRAAAIDTETLPLVPVSDVRQALAWLCGRTQRPDTCTLAHNAAAVTVGSARPYRQAGSASTVAPSRVDAQR